MPQIYIMAAITTIVALALWGGLIYLFTGHQKRYFWLLLLGLPLSTLANIIVKPKMISTVGRMFQVQPGLGLASPAWFLAFMVLLTPLVEEPIKILPLLLRPASNMIASRTSALWVGFVLGVSYGLGEAVFLAYAIAEGGAYDFLPWYAFTGFLNERIMACFAHGVLTAVLVTGIQRRGRYILHGFLSALSLHLFLNAPTAMYQLQWISYELYSFIIVIPFIVLAVIFERIRRAARRQEDDQSENEIVYWRQHFTE